MNNTNIKIVIGSKPMSDGNYGIYLRITKNRKKKEISLGIRCKLNHFENGELTRKHKEYKIDNEVILELKRKAYSIVRDFQRNSYNFSLEEFENKFRGIEYEKQKEDAIQLFNEIIGE